MTQQGQGASVWEHVPTTGRVFRRLNKDWYVPDAGGGYRVSSQAFQDKEGSVSVGLECVLNELDLPPQTVLLNHPGYGLAGVAVGYVVGDELQLRVAHEPTGDEPWHGGIHGKKTKSVCNKLAAAATEGLVVAPTVSVAEGG